MAVRNHAKNYFLENSEESDENSETSHQNIVEEQPLIKQNLDNKWNGISIAILQSNKDSTFPKARFRYRNWAAKRTELMTKNGQRNWRRLLLGGLVAIIVLGLVTAAIILLSGTPTESRNTGSNGSAVALDDSLWGSLSTSGFNGTWLSDEEILYRYNGHNLIIRNMRSGSTEYVLDNNNDALSSSFNHKISADRKYILLASNYQKYFRHTFVAQYTIINLESRNEIILTIDNSTSFQLVIWAPRGNALVCVYQNNIYYRPQAEINRDYQITTSGIFTTVYNGVPDWVYEEEIFSSNKVMWFSPNAKRLAFAHFDDTNTPVMNIPFYGYPGSLAFQYTSAIPIHYPKPGTINPTVKLYWVDLEAVIKNNITLFEVDNPPELKNSESILASVSFPTDNLIASTWMNRVQNEAYISILNVETSRYTTALSHVEKNGWVELFEAPIFSKDGTAFLLILPQRQIDNADWRQLVIVEDATSSRSKVTALTRGKFVVTDILSWDEDNHRVYYLATSENDPAQQHLYRISSRVSNYKSECLSCNVRSPSDQGTYCLYNTASFSPNNSYYVLTCAGPGVPDVSIYSSRNSSKLLTWEDNKDAVLIMAERRVPSIKRFTVPVGDNFQAQVRLLIPPGADLSGATKYPMLLYVYGGPDTYQVTEKFNVDWGTDLVLKKNIVYAAIDGRGSGLKGNAMLFAGYRNLGTVEIYDQINVTRHIQEHLPFIDKARTAIWGWSYGGYAAGMSLALDKEDIFKCGISVAPVTDWALYDSIYTERFMGLPIVEDNLGGYEHARLFDKVENIKPNSYYLIHGTFDDNVHYQQSLLLAKVLEQKDILFRQQTYTDEDHSIGQSRTHLYHSMENFLDNCFAH